MKYLIRLAAAALFALLVVGNERVVTVAAQCTDECTVASDCGQGLCLRDMNTGCNFCEAQCNDEATMPDGEGYTDCQAVVSMGLSYWETILCGGPINELVCVQWGCGDLGLEWSCAI